MNPTLKEQKDLIIQKNNEVNSLTQEYTSLFEHSQVGILYLDEDGHFTKVNKKFCEMLKYESKELLGLTFSDITYKDDKDKYVTVYKDKKEGKAACDNLEKRYVRKDGKVIWIEIFINHVKDNNGNFLYTLGFITNISKRKKIQDTILEQTKRMQLYLDIVDVAIVVINNKGNITLVNRKTCEILGYEEYLLLGKNWFHNFVSEENRDCSINEFVEAIEKETDISEKIQYDVICSNFDKRTILWRRKYIFDENKKIVGMISSGEDITDFIRLENEKKKNEEILFTQSKVASMGEMLKNIAHQWRQPLSTISTAASGIKLQKEMGILKDEDFDMGMSAIVEMTQYLSQTINELQNFFNVDNKVKKFTNIDFLSKVENFVLTSFQTFNIELLINTKESVNLKTFYNEVIQIVLNILNNSRDAFSEKYIENKVVIIEDYLENNNYTLLIKDNAGGIKEKNINRIFEPYFTTKQQKLGTGIGLFMVKDIVINRLGGKIDVYNDSFEYKGEINQGAVFKITVPKEL
eukprot:TRINITY_DN67307_c0_g1_i1.p1 TRINITY_DN67307_c0_g1~~TRINITY_DN67307_c0_g1_i1.p1  ORF type:complete len:521 (+),score=70.07 TRINITY_DN67307_c0_g1_i1:1090-2652(+)